MRNEHVEGSVLIWWAKTAQNGMPRGVAVAKPAAEGAKDANGERTSGTARRRGRAVPLGAAFLSEEREP
jgi:hypothetical protein